MKKFIALVGTASILLPSAAFAGSLNNTNGVNAMRSTAAGFSQSDITVNSHIEIDNEVNISSESYSSALDITAENARSGHRELGHAHYNEASGGGSAGGRVAADGDYTEAYADGYFNADGSESSSAVSGEGELSAAFAAEDSFDFEKEVTSNTSGERKRIWPFAQGGERSSEDNLEIDGSRESARAADVALDFQGEGSQEAQNYEVSASGEVDYVEGSLDAEGEGAATGSYTEGGWRGRQAESYLDGSLSASLSGGWSAVNGVINETGYTDTEVNINSFETTNSFGKSADSFRNVSF